MAVRSLRSAVFVPFLLLLLLAAPAAVRAQAGAASPPGQVYYFPANTGGTGMEPVAGSGGLMAAGGGVPQAVQAAGPTSDDRENTRYTPWNVYQHQSVAGVVNTANASGLRVVDLYVETDATPYLFTAVYVANSGTYAKPWWFVAGLTPSALLTFVTNNNARIVVSKAFADPAPGGDVLYYAILVANTGADQKAWWFYKGQTPAQISALWQNNNARLVQVHSYVKNAVTVYDVVMIANTGDDNRAWWWYVNATPTQILNNLNANNARLLDLDYDPVSGNYNAIMNSCAAGCPRWWWYTNVTTANLINTVSAVNARIIDANSSPGCGDRCWNLVLVSNALSADVDGDGNVDALSDGLLLLRYLFGLRGPALIANAVSTGATRTTAADIEAYLRSLVP